ncbi:hypothetical protein [Methylobacterium nodulans]|uniref:Uncharacterized protein n=1 Tax=Methylobacterium nodulans (strain LMG 21967 / CNCM I-2342 / ORS 2060) TaxID=460265 RepID=B8IDT5_METNO|nr:hypothetical protein [Methylobacterium nodulans]ACL55657.1 hypothetical protein Mnod_0621 [Methylobacterium nodulans ORS 2060]
MSAPHDRRAFLRGLVGLPLIGGGITLIGNPTAAAEPVTSDLLKVYSTWLWGERVRVEQELGREGDRIRGVTTNAGYWYHHAVPEHRNPPPSTRAAVVLSAVGCDWRGGRP